MYKIWLATTDKTSTSIRLNSSKHIQHPVLINPINSLSIIFEVFYSEQLNTIQYLPNNLAISLQLSVLPVPAGPAGFAPNLF